MFQCLNIVFFLVLQVYFCQRIVKNCQTLGVNLVKTANAQPQILIYWIGIKWEDALAAGQTLVGLTK